jgi:hypothetical protein
MPHMTCMSNTRFTCCQLSAPNIKAWFHLMSLHAPFATRCRTQKPSKNRGAAGAWQNNTVSNLFLLNLQIVPRVKMKQKVCSVR